MSGESPKKIGQGYERNLEVGQFQPMIDSWDLHLQAEKKSAKTIRTYLEAAQWFAAEHLIPAGFTDWDEVDAVERQLRTPARRPQLGPGCRCLASGTPIALAR